MAEKKTGQLKKVDIDALITYSPTDAAITKMEEAYGKLKVRGIDDTNGYKICHEARMDVKSQRVGVEGRRKELKIESLTFGRKVDSRAREISMRLTGIETHLREQQDIVDNEKQRIKDEEERKAQEKLDGRIVLLQKYDCVLSVSELERMDDDEFNDLADKVREAFEQEKAERIAEEEQLEKERQAEQERIQKLEIERAEQDKKIAEQEKENQKLRADAEVKRQADQKAAQKKLDAERKEREEENRKLQADIAAREAAEEEREQVRQVEVEHAKARIADAKLFEQIKNSFPTLPLAWSEIARLMKKTKKK